MNFREACKRLEAGGLTVVVSMRQDTPVEILFFDKVLNDWNRYCGIDDDENIDEDARKDIEELW